MAAGKTLAEIAEILGGRVVGDPGFRVTGLAALESAGPEELSFLANPRYAAAARRSAAGALLVRLEKEATSAGAANAVVVEDPYYAFARLLGEFHPRPSVAPGVHAAAVVAADAELGAGVSVGARAVVGAGCRLGARADVRAGAVLGPGVAIGEDTVVHPNAVLYEGTTVGARCVVHAGAVLGADGFGFAPYRGAHHKIPQVGRLVVEDDVEIGANSTIDRATLGETRIGAGTKIDNLVQVAHNVTVGRNCILVSQSGIAGSTTLGDGVTLAGQAGCVGHVSVGAGTVVLARAVVTKDIPERSRVSGFPAVAHREWLRVNAALRELPALVAAARRGRSGAGPATPDAAPDIEEDEP